MFPRTLWLTDGIRCCLHQTTANMTVIQLRNRFTASSTGLRRGTHEKNNYFLAQFPINVTKASGSVDKKQNGTQKSIFVYFLYQLLTSDVALMFTFVWRERTLSGWTSQCVICINSGPHSGKTNRLHRRNNGSCSHYVASDRQVGFKSRFWQNCHFSFISGFSGQHFKI